VGKESARAAGIWWYAISVVFTNVGKLRGQRGSLKFGKTSSCEAGHEKLDDQKIWKEFSGNIGEL